MRKFLLLLAPFPVFAFAMDQEVGATFSQYAQPVCYKDSSTGVCAAPTVTNGGLDINANGMTVNVDTLNAADPRNNVGGAAPATAVTMQGSDGTNTQIPRVYDTNTGAGFEYTLGMVLRGSTSSGSVEIGTQSHPLIVAPDGVTAQPVSGTFWQATQPVSVASLPLPTGAAQEHVTAGSPNSCRLSDGTSFLGTSGAPLNVAIVSGGGTGGTASSFGAAFPATGTAIGVMNSAGTGMTNLGADSHNSLKVVLYDSSGNPIGTAALGRDAAANLPSMSLSTEDYAAISPLHGDLGHLTDGTQITKVDVKPSGTLWDTGATGEAITASTQLLTGTANARNITDLVLSVLSDNSTVNIRLVYGTGTVCATGTTTLLSTIRIKDGVTGMPKRATPFQLPANQDLCVILVSGSGTFTAQASGTY